MTDFKFSKLFIDENARSDEITRRLLAVYPDTKQEFISDASKFLNQLANHSLSEGKRILWLTHFKGNYLKPCPGTAKSYRCCNYLVINETTNCPIDCSYCILQGYINNPAITIYTNYHKIINEIQQLSINNPQRILRIGTGELSDSLALDPITHLSEKLISQVQKLPNVLLELKSKTDNIDHILNLSPEKIILAWSINPIQVVKSEEHKSAPIHKRLEAARRAANRGFMIAIHFDPIIYTQNWKIQYTDLIDLMGNYIMAKSIAWISLGSLRYPPHLKQIARQRFPKSQIFTGEQITGLDGKTRYLRPIRQQMYHLIADQIKSKWKDVFIYFCMESEEIWQEVLGKAPKDNLEVDWYFAQNLYYQFRNLKLPKPNRAIYSNEIKFSLNNEN